MTFCWPASLPAKAWAWLPVSFAAIQRKGLVFTPLAEAALLRVQLGLAVLPGREEFADELDGS